MLFLAVAICTASVIAIVAHILDDMRRDYTPSPALCGEEYPDLIRLDNELGKIIPPPEVKIEAISPHKNSIIRYTLTMLIDGQRESRIFHGNLVTVLSTLKEKYDLINYQNILDALDTRRLIGIIMTKIYIYESAFEHAAPSRGTEAATIAAGA